MLAKSLKWGTESMNHFQRDKGRETSHTISGFFFFLFKEIDENINQQCTPVMSV